MTFGLQTVLFKFLGETIVKRVSHMPALILNEDELAVAHLLRNSWKYPVEARKVLVERLRAPKLQGARTITEIRHFDRTRLPLGGLVVAGQIGKPDQALGVMILAIRRFHQIAADKIIERRKSTCRRMAPGVAFDRRKALAGQLRTHRIHADFRIYEDMWRIGQNFLTQVLDREWPPHETFAD